MTIGTILPDIMAECGLSAAMPLINDQAFEMRQIKAFMQAAGDEIARRADWSRLSRTITGSNATALALNDDFSRLSEANPVTRGGGHRPVRVVTSPAMWQMLEATPSAQHHCHIRDGSILFSPAIGPEGVTVRYQSNLWLGGSSTIASNDHTPVFPERLLARGTIWRFRRQKGITYDDVLAEFEADLAAEIASDRGGQ